MEDGYIVALRSLHQEIDALRVLAKSKLEHPATPNIHRPHYATEVMTLQLVLDLIEGRIRD